MLLRRFVLLAIAALAVSAEEEGATLIIRGENPVVIVGQQDYFTDYGEAQRAFLCNHSS